MGILMKDRFCAGHDLAQAMLKYRKRRGVIVLALPRGGVAVGAEIARVLHVPLDIVVVRKLGAPQYEELAIGAIASGGVRVLNQEIIDSLHIDQATIETITEREQRELERRMSAYRGDRAWPAIEGRHVILTDDGIATGATMHAAIVALHRLNPAGITVAAPVAAFESLARLRREVDEVVCLATPFPFGAVGTWYETFPQLGDEDVRSLLAKRWAEESPVRTGFVGQRPRPLTETARSLAARPCRSEDVTLSSGTVSLPGELTVPGPAHGLVVFAHGSGSSRFSARNRFVARYLNELGLATLLFDLLTVEEQRRDEHCGALRFDVGLLTRRLVGALDDLEAHPAVRGLAVGLFGSSTGAAAALNAAAERPDHISAVVCRGGRPDLAQTALPVIRAPTLFIVGALDEVVLHLNQRAAAALRCVHRLEIVPDASHLFEEEGALEEVARHARAWFDRYLSSARNVPQTESANEPVYPTGV